MMSESKENDIFFSSTEDRDAQLFQCRENLYAYGIKVSKQLKNEFIEKKELRIELDKKNELMAKLEKDLAQSKRMFSDSSGTWTLKFVEEQKKAKVHLQNLEQHQSLLGEEKEKNLELSKENEEMKKEVSDYKATVDSLMKEANQQRENSKVEMDALTRDVELLGATLERLRDAFKIGNEWLLHFGEQVSELGYLTEENDKIALDLYRNLNETVESLSGKDDATIWSNVMGSLSLPKLPVPSTVALKSHQEEKSPTKVDVATSPIHTPEVEPVIPSYGGENDISADSCKESDSNSFRSGSSSECELRCLNFPKDKLSPLPSSPVQTKQQSPSFLGSLKNCNLSGKVNKRSVLKRSANAKQSFFSPKKQKLARQSSYGFNSTLNTPTRGSQKKKRKVEDFPLGTPKFILSHDDMNPNVIMCLPLGRSVKEQSVNVSVLDDHVMLGYKQVRNSSSPRNTSLDQVDKCSDKSELQSISGTVNTNRNTPSRRKLLKTRVSCDVDPSQAVSASTNMPNSHSLLSKHKTSFHNGNPEPCEIGHNPDTEEDQSQLSVSTHESDNAEYESVVVLEKTEDVDCGEVIAALEKLELVGSDEEMQKVLTDRLKLSLCKIDERRASNAVDVTVSFLCSRISNPLFDYMQTNDRVCLFPRDELSVVRAFNTIGNPDLMNLLVEVIHEKILVSCCELPISTLAVLCRVCSSLHALKESPDSAKHLCYELFKNCSDTAPYLVASIASVWSDLLKQPTLMGSETFLRRVVNYLIMNKPDGLADNLWNEASYFLKDYIDTSACMSPEELADSIVKGFVAHSSVDQFEEQDAYNYTTALELVCSRSKWPWVYQNVVQKSLCPFIDSFVTTARRKLSGAAALSYRIIGVLGSGHGDAESVWEFVKCSSAKLLTKRNRVPDYIMKEVYYAYHRLQGHDEEEMVEDSQALKNWLIRHLESQ